MTDEEFARELLCSHFDERGNSGFSCNVNSNDPPDLLVTWKNGAQWGVEVTRCYQQVLSGSRSDTISSASVTEPLRRFGEMIGEKTKHIRQRDYTIFLGPSPADSLSGQPVSFSNTWRKEVEQQVRKHIENDRPDRLYAPRLSLKPGNPGTRWTVLTSAGVANVESATYSMLQQAISDKTIQLPNWKGCFAKRWLLLLNSYPLVSDVSEVERILRKITVAHPDGCRFDGIYWGGYPDRALLSIPL